LSYVKLLIGSCLDRKVKFGSAVWNVTRYKTYQDKLNGMIPNLLKRVMQVPSSTPSTAIQYEFGINDLTIEILMEKVILAVETLNRDETRISKMLLTKMMEKSVPGFCTELVEACDLLDVSMDQLIKESDVREKLKKKVIEIQSRELLKRMVISSKMDRVLTSGYSYTGKMMKYLSELNFVEARAIFMSRYRMWPTKDNFPGRWNGVECNVCGLTDTDEHIMSCPGYCDLVGGKFEFEVFWDNEVLEDTKTLKVVANIVVLLVERMEHIQNIGCR
jgi:hypothetical protein